jgi:hypothetical protein
MHLDFRYAYLVLDIPFLVIWAALFALSKRTAGSSSL